MMISSFVGTTLNRSVLVSCAHAPCAQARTTIAREQDFRISRRGSIDLSFGVGWRGRPWCSDNAGAREAAWSALVARQCSLVHGAVPRLVTNSTCLFLDTLASGNGPLW